MCLYKLRSTPKKPQVAKSDITVYKIFIEVTNKKRYKSPYRHCYYNVGELANATIDPQPCYVVDEKRYRYSEGIHSLRSLRSAKKYFKQNVEWIRNFSSAATLVILQCTIPAGSKYILGYNGEILSNRLIINKL